MKHQTKNFALLLAALALAVGLVACGGDSDGGDTVTGTFEPLVSVSSAYKNVSGEAELTRADGETTTAISLDGLVPDTEYMAHLHTGGCGGSDPGGPHFKFNPSLGEEPTNEIHLSFTANGDGSGKAETTSDREVPAGEAGSVVLHLADGEMAAVGSEQFAALFVHEGVDHSKEGPGHDQRDGHQHEAGEPTQPESSDKIACAELEGAPTETAGSGPSTVPTIEVKGGEPVGGVAELEFDAGDEVRFRVSSDAAEEIHVHGYDIAKDVPAGGSVEIAFPADIEGIFEVELEALGTQIAELRVNP